MSVRRRALPAKETRSHERNLLLAQFVGHAPLGKPPGGLTTMRLGYCAVRTGNFFFFQRHDSRRTCNNSTHRAFPVSLNIRSGIRRKSYTPSTLTPSYGASHCGRRFRLVRVLRSTSRTGAFKSGGSCVCFLAARYVESCSFHHSPTS